MKKRLLIFCFTLLTAINLRAQQRATEPPKEYSKTQQQTDTVKCFVQIMIPAEGAMGVARNIESNFLFLNGGMLIYTRAYAISDTSGHYIKFLNPRKKELKDIWLPDEKPVIMKKDW